MNSMTLEEIIQRARQAQTAINQLGAGKLAILLLDNEEAVDRLLGAIINGTGIYQDPDDGSIHIDNADDIPNFARAIIDALRDAP